MTHLIFFFFHGASAETSADLSSRPVQSVARSARLARARTGGVAAAQSARIRRSRP